MPFLNKAILVELLKTYPGADQIEANYKSLVKNYKEDPLSFLVMIRDGSIKFKNSSFGLFGFNTNDKSEACYLEIRALIDDATRNNRIEAWADIICTAGEGGYHTFTNSVFESKLCRAAFALLMYIRNQIDSRIKLIEEKVKAAEDKSKPLDIKPRSLEDRIKALQDKIHLDEDDELPLKIHSSIAQRILDYKKFIQEALDNIERSKNLKLSALFANKLEINTKSGQEFHTSSLKMIEVARRHLFFLGDDSIYLKAARELFPKFPFTIDKLCKDYNLTESQAKGLNINLPIFLQRIYPSLYIKDHRTDLKYVVDESKVIESFEQLERIKTTTINTVKSNNAGEEMPNLAKELEPPSFLTNEEIPILEMNADPVILTPHPIKNDIEKKDILNPPLSSVAQNHGEEDISPLHSLSNINGLFKTDSKKEIKPSPSPQSDIASPEPQSM